MWSGVLNKRNWTSSSEDVLKIKWRKALSEDMMASARWHMVKQCVILSYSEHLGHPVSKEESQTLDQTCMVRKRTRTRTSRAFRGRPLVVIALVSWSHENS